eukprot:gene6819-113_t
MLTRGVGEESDCVRKRPVFAAWERAWDRIKKEHAPKKRCPVRDRAKVIKVPRE